MSVKAGSLRIDDVAIEPFDLESVSDRDIAAVNTFVNVLQAESMPEEPAVTLERTALELRNVPDLIAIWMFLAREADGSIAALGNGSYVKTDDNAHLLNTSIEVRSDHRRRGLATAMLGLLAGVADAEGRTLLSGSTSERVPAGEAFARRVGAEAAQAAHTNRLVLADVDRGLMRRWVDDGPKRAPGYSLLFFEGRCPDELIDDVVDVMEVMNDAPRDDRQVEDMHITASMYREMDDMMEAHGYQHWALFVRHDATGRLVGLSDVAWDPAQPKTISQQNTGVRPEHRGHGLGKWLKAAMLERILENGPPATDIRTGNADSNDAMLSINRELGFRPHTANVIWELTVDRARQYLAER